MLRRHEHKFKSELFRGIDTQHKLRKSRAEGGGRKAEENSEAAETCGRDRTEGGGVRAEGNSGRRRIAGSSVEGTTPTAREWEAFDLWDAEEEKRLAAGGDLEAV